MVEAGETLRGIAAKYEVTAAQLREANDIPAGKGVEVGQRLRLPRAAVSSAPLAVASERAARARSSDEPRRTEAARDSARPRERSSATPSRRDSTEKRTTRTDSTSRTRTGTAERRTTARDSASTRPRTTSSPETQKRETARPSQHTVKAGETLYGIARQYGIGVDALREANDMGTSNTLQPGQKLRIPR
ncbi:MAG TPA: LysM peptidoglycan-binding domain-containing protein [Longimicrobium sp.]|jgi:LysM repeat protein